MWITAIPGNVPTLLFRKPSGGITLLCVQHMYMDMYMYMDTHFILHGDSLGPVVCVHYLKAKPQHCACIPLSYYI